MVFSTYNTKDFVRINHLVWSDSHLVLILISDLFAEVVNLLLCDSLCIHDFEAIKINNLFGVIVLIYFIVDLPSYIIIDVLKHFLVLVI